MIAGVVDTGDKFIAGVVDTEDKFITGVSDTGDKFIAGVVDIAEQLFAGDNDLLPVTRTRTPWRWAAAKDRKKLNGINRRYFRPPKSATAADGVIKTAMKSCIHKHPTHLDMRPPKLNNAVLVCSSFGGLRGL